MTGTGEFVCSGCRQMRELACGSVAGRGQAVMCLGMLLTSSPAATYLAGWLARQGRAQQSQPVDMVHWRMGFLGAEQHHCFQCDCVSKQLVLRSLRLCPL